MVWWLGLCNLTAQGLGSIPGGETRNLVSTSHTVWPKKKQTNKNQLKLIFMPKRHIWGGIFYSSSIYETPMADSIFRERGKQRRSQ